MPNSNSLGLGRVKFSPNPLLPSLPRSLSLSLFQRRCAEAFEVMVCRTRMTFALANGYERGSVQAAKLGAVCCENETTDAAVRVTLA